MLKSKYIKILAATCGLALATTVQAQVILGSFQSAGDPNNAGWVDSQNNTPISTSTNCSFVNAGVTGYTTSLVASGPGGFGHPQLVLSLSPAQIAGFNSNSWLTFTFSVPAGTYTGGYSQLYNLAFNASGYGYNNQNWANALEMGNTNNTAPGTLPNYYFNNGSNGVQTMVVSMNYSSVTNAIIGGGEGYLQMTFQFNNGGGAPTNIILNNVFLSQKAFGVGIATNIFYIVDDFSTNGVGPTNPVGMDYFAAAAYPYIVPTNITSVWSEWFGNGGPGATAPSITFNPNQNVSGNTNANGAMAINFTWNAATDGYQQWLIWHGNNQTYVPTVAGGTAGISYPAYTNVECDVKFDPSSVTNANGDYGVLRIGIRGVGDFSQSWLNTITITDTNWHHLSAAIPASNPDSLNIADAIVGEDVTSGVGNGGLTGNQIVYVDNIRFTGALATPQLAPPTVTILPAKPGLRIWAGSSANTFDRATISTMNQNESWISPSSYPVTYTFSLLSYPSSGIGQTMLQLVPLNSNPNAPLGGTFPAGGNQYFDYQATNGLWLVLTPNGGGAVVASIYWKTNLPNSNPYTTSNTAFASNPAGLALQFTNSTAIGTWSLKFSSATAGTLTAPGGSARPFTIGDPNVSTDFANPVMAIFGFQPNSTAGEGLWEDWGVTSITGTSGGNINDDWTQQSQDFVSGTSPDGAFSAQGSANPQEIIISRKGLDAYWFTWTTPAPPAGFGVVAGTNLQTSPLTWVDPAFYANNTDYYPPRANASVLLGPIYVTLMPYADLPTKSGNPQSSPPAIDQPLAPNAYFIGTTNFNNQYP